MCNRVLIINATYKIKIYLDKKGKGPNVHYGETNLSLRRYCPVWEWAKEANVTRTDLLNPTSGRDASPSQLISMSS